VSTRALRRFPWLDARLAEIDVHRISKLHLEGPRGTTVDIATADPSVLLLRRVDFDHLLVREAVRAGATLVERFEVTQVAASDSGVTFTSRDGRTLRAPAVVAADGVHSVTAKRLGVNARWPETGLAIDMMEETRSARCRPRGPTCCGSRTRIKIWTATPTFFPRPITSTSASAVSCRTSNARWTRRPMSCSSSS
jgi:flavin-dependent dehydrogenase